MPVLLLDLDGVLNPFAAAEAGRRWAAGRSAPTLLVSIDPAIGLTRADVDRVLAWAAAPERFTAP